MNFVWTSVFVAVLAVSTFALLENEQQYLQELLDAGVSDETAQKIVNVAAQHNNDGADPNKSGGSIFQAIIDETNAIMAQAPAADQEAYKNFVEDKKNQYEKPDEIENSDDE